MTALGVAALAAVLGSCDRPTAGRQLEPAASARPAPLASDTSVATAPDGSPPPAVLPGYVEMTVGGVAETPRSQAVVLVDLPRERGLLIFVGAAEAMAIDLRLRHRSFARPLTHDLLEDALEKLDAHVESARIDRLEKNVFFGTVVLSARGRTIDLDSRSSDAVALALGNGAPLFVATRVLQQAGVDLADLPELDHADAGVEPSERQPAVEL